MKTTAWGPPDLYMVEFVLFLNPIKALVGILMTKFDQTEKFLNLSMGEQNLPMGEQKSESKVWSNGKVPQTIHGRTEFTHGGTEITRGGTEIRE